MHLLHCLPMFLVKIAGDTKSNFVVNERLDDIQPTKNPIISDIEYAVSMYVYRCLKTVFTHTFRQTYSVLCEVG